MNAIDEIKETYTLEDFKEIADHGCQSGVCRKHIYYGDTISFFEKYEDQVIDYITDCYDDEFLVDVFRDSHANIDTYKNNLVWCFIELIAMEVDEEHRYDYAIANGAIIEYA